MNELSITPPPEKRLYRHSFGFVKVAAAIPQVRVADCMYNVSKITEAMVKAATAEVSMVCFPELSITSYSCADLFFQHTLLDNAQKALKQLLKDTASLDTIGIVGMPVMKKNRLYNAAVIIQKGEILAVVPKTNLPNSEKRWFTYNYEQESTPIKLAGKYTQFAVNEIILTNEFSFGVEIGEDLWGPSPKSSDLAANGAEIIFNLSASSELVGKHTYRRQLIEQQSARCHCGYVYASAGYGESTTEMVFGGCGIIAENGTVLAESQRFSIEAQMTVCEIDVERLRSERMRNSIFFNKRNSQDLEVDYEIHSSTSKRHIKSLTRKINPYPFIPPIEKRDEYCEEIFAIQTTGLAKRWQHTGVDHLVIGVSGGLDSTLALLVCARTADQLGFNRNQILGITMPGFGTTDRTYNNALKLMKSLGVSSLEINIRDACLQHFKDIGHNPNVHDVTYENGQARERTQILMDLANKRNGLVVGTGDLSEIALGWSTYNGDHISMYNVNAGIPKTLVRFLVAWGVERFDDESGKTLRDILDTPVSPELLPGDETGKIRQKTEDIIGPYELHDFFLYYFIRFGFSSEKIVFLAQQAFEQKYTQPDIHKWLKIFLKRFFQHQFKRSCSPDSPKIGSVNLSSLNDWQMPSDAYLADW